MNHFFAFSQTMHSHQVIEDDKDLLALETKVGHQLTCTELSNYLTKDNNDWTCPLSCCYSCFRQEYSIITRYAIKVQRLYQCTLCHYWTCNVCLGFGSNYEIIAGKHLYFCPVCCDYLKVFCRKTELFQRTIPKLRTLTDISFHWSGTLNDSIDVMICKKRKRTEDEITEWH